MKDTIDTLFDDLEGSFDVANTPQGHKARFMQLLREEHIEPKKKNATGVKKTVLFFIAAAACITVILSLGIRSFNDNTATTLAEVSPEMEKTESFFTAAIQQELTKLKAFNNPEIAQIVEETLTEITLLESQYEQLKKDLTTSGNDTRVIAAMISNFQNRIDLLQEVIKTIEEINNYKNKNDEYIL